eukprot:10592865-Ditylum_brightwellii.AAC.1
MSDDEGGESLDEFESMNEEISVESEIVDVSNVSLSSESSSPSELDEERLFDIHNVELMVVILTRIMRRNSFGEEKE